MKKYLSLIFGAALLITACTDNDKDPVLQVGPAPSITAPAANSSFVLQESTGGDEFGVFTWTAASFGFDAAVNYTLELDKAGNNFQDPIVVGAVNALSLAGITNNKINNILLSKGLPADESSDVEFRVVARVNPDVDPVYSSPITLKITPYQVVIVYPQLQVPGSYQGWKPEDNNTVIFSVRSDGKYEGYIDINDAQLEFKYTQGTTWDTNWGDNGADGTLEPGGANIKVPSAGLYKLNVDLNALTHTFQKTDWSMIGTAVGGWDVDKAMTYDDATRKLTATLDLVAGEFKFRANAAWDINLGDDNADKKLEYGGANIAVASDGNYTIELNLSGAVYTYKLTRN